MLSEENIADNHVRRQKAKTNDSVTPGIGLNNLIIEATPRVERKSYTDVEEMLKQLLHPKSV